MNQKKMLILLLVITLYINYQNYIEEDTAKINNKIANMEKRTLKEEKLNENTEKLKIVEILDYEKTMYDGDKISYSEAMGKFQQLIEKSAKGECTVLDIRWSEIPKIEDKWYEMLSIKLSLECSTTAFIAFQNQLQSHKHLIALKQIRMTRKRKKSILRILTQVVSYRKKAKSQ